MNQELQIKSWAHMLDEAMEDKGIDKDIDENIAGQDGITPIRNSQLAKRVNRPTVYMIIVDSERILINSYTSHFVTASMQLTQSVENSDENKAFKTTDMSKLIQMINKVIAKYSDMNVIVCHNNYVYAPMRRQDCKRFGVTDIYEPGYGWRNGGYFMKFANVAEDEMIDEIDLSQCEGSMANIILNQIVQTDALNQCKTKEQVYDLVKTTFEKNGLNTLASRRLLFKVQHSRDLVSAMSTVMNSYAEGSGFGVNGPRRSFKRDMYEDEPIDERRMDGPAAAVKGGKDEIAEFRQMLDTGVVEFNFRKADGTLRHAIGTTSEAVVPTAERQALDPNYKDDLESYQRRAAFIIWFWDLEKNECRCFNTNRFEGLVKFEPTNKHIDNNVTQVGDIFIHRDVDAEIEDPNKITPEKAEEIYNDINDELTAGNGDIVGALVGGGFVNTEAFNEIAIQVGPTGEPILKIIIRKKGNENDQPYPLRINELRKAILDKYGVNIKKVVIDGEFQF